MTEGPKIPSLHSAGGLKSEEPAKPLMSAASLLTHMETLLNSAPVRKANLAQLGGLSGGLKVGKEKGTKEPQPSDVKEVEAVVDFQKERTKRRAKTE